jgi:hypothetical protein
VQGGVFSSTGHLYLVCDDQTGVLGFDMYSGCLGCRVPVDYQPGRRADFSYQELEGITLMDADTTELPGIEGQMHVLMVENRPLRQDVIYFKHYGTSDPDRPKI